MSAARNAASGSRDPLRVLWTGDGEVAVWKPAGLSSERPLSQSASPAGSSPVTEPLESAIALARAQFGWPDAQLPHRLDRPTAGILMIAANRTVAAAHAAEQREGRWTKWYIARACLPRVPPPMASGAASRPTSSARSAATCVAAADSPESSEVAAIPRGTR